MQEPPERHELGEQAQERDDADEQDAAADESTAGTTRWTASPTS
jgi:hypothetical protein